MSGPRYSTEIPTENYLKYRKDKRTKPGDFYYGKDSDMLYKTWVAMKRGAIVGACTGLTMCTYFDTPAAYSRKPQTTAPFKFGPALVKLYRHGLPPLIAATTFGATMSLAANIRNKEDAWNHAIGGYAAGTMFGVWYKAPKVGFWSGVFLAIVGSSFKKMSEYGVFDRPLTVHHERVFDFYRTGWMIERPHQEGVDDADKSDDKNYKP